ncbi:ABC transporter permease subunit [Halorubellus litoreus]|uniref:ABC transporter permease subunit n=1 Tax=Halorubellus litoreus TaxID=755308 RepID=A0ABD5VFA9_9EURY
MTSVLRGAVHVARIEVLDRTSGVLAGLGAVVLCAFLALQTVTLFVARGDVLLPATFVVRLETTFAFLVPLAATVLSAATVVAERETGTVRLLLSVPYERRAVLAGKLAGRAAVAVGVAVVGVAIALAGATAFGPLSVPTVVVFAALTVWLALAFVAVSVATSVVADSTRSALGNALAFVAVSTVLGPLCVNYLVFLGATERVRRSIQMLFPTSAYGELLSVTLAPSANADPMVTAVACASVGFWLVVPVAYAVSRFDRTAI